MSERMTARKRQALEMRGRIQSAALDLFDREGFENVSVEEIAQAAGCSVGNIYHYFKSKDELAIQVTSHVDDAYSELEEGYLTDTARPAREKLLDFVGRSLEISVSDPVLYKAFIHGLRYPEQRVLQKNAGRVYFRVLLELVTLCQQEGSIHPSHDPGSCCGAFVMQNRQAEWRLRAAFLEKECIAICVPLPYNKQENFEGSDRDEVQRSAQQNLRSHCFYFRFSLLTGIFTGHFFWP